MAEPNTEDAPAGRGAAPPGWAARLAAAAGHGVGVLAVALAMGLWALPGQTVLALFGYARLAPDAVVGSMGWGLALHLGLAACVWAMGVIAWRLWRLRRVNKPTVIRSSAGVVLTEFLVILPVYVLLMFGLAQLALNNVAGILARVAEYEAGRAAWIWHPEQEASRAGVDEARMTDKIRITVALVMAPVAAADFNSGSSAAMGVAVGDDLSQDARQVRAMMASRFPGLSGTIDAALPIDWGSQELSLSKGLDHSDFSARAVRKFTHAYYATDPEQIDVQVTDGKITTTFVYQHFQAMPAVGHIFGDYQGGLFGTGGVGGRQGYYQKIEGAYALPIQKYKVNTAHP